MNNKPVLSETEWIDNFLGSCVLDPVSFLPIHSYTHQPINFFIQNKPNYTNHASSPTSPNGPRVTGNDLCKTNPIPTNN